MSRLPTYFISHGGGPWPWIPDMRKMFVNLEASLARMPEEIGEIPKAILMVSGHWEAPEFAVMSSPKPPMVYDYSGFPAHTYDITYPAPGAPDLAQRTADLLAQAGLPTRLDAAQGFDHGTFVPAYIMYPEANVPVYQVSLQHGYDPQAHFALGRALAPLRDEGVLIVGSGLSYHNLRLFGPGAKDPSTAFDTWLQEVLARDPEARTQALLNWEEAPYARVCHREEDHLVPLFAALGAAEGARATQVYHDEGLFGGVTASSYRFDG
ncbi:DODA-type extradiol aromatic ring-opening family dioxygenase [Actibacterium sp. XHP0104]|uniref:DODA-type extradiol aromatic ring-opening family dioxygenase n=1 Tax=Actibacterium sp. XHP0104 TaxID=2984335 RepID=UPI0021E95167|nr:class III extradiol ring-cleavage dioxygenase [Actibacterium sp. XHP0104]MCV2881379.1 dioxygenase [Actibacterium sp. XHP0104]